MIRFFLLTILLSTSFMLLSQEDEKPELSWKQYKMQQKKVDSIHKLMTGTFKQYAIGEIVDGENIDTLVNFTDHNKNLNHKDKLSSVIKIKSSGKYSQEYSEKNYEETLKGNTSVFNFETDSLYIRIALVLYEKGISQVKFYHYSDNDKTLYLKELNSNRIHLFRKD